MEKRLLTFSQRFSTRFAPRSIVAYAWSSAWTGAFFRRDVLEFLDSARAEYAIKVPFYPWLHLKAAVAQAAKWIRIDDTVSFCETRTRVAAWNQVRRIVLYRKPGGSRDAQELPARPVRPRRRPLRVLGDHHQQTAERPESVALPQRSRDPREGLR